MVAITNYFHYVRIIVWYIKFSFISFVRSTIPPKREPVTIIYCYNPSKMLILRGLKRCSKGKFKVIKVIINYEQSSQVKKKKICKTDGSSRNNQKKGGHPVHKGPLD